MSEHPDWWELDIESLAEKLYETDKEYWELETGKGGQPSWECLPPEERGAYIDMAKTVSREMHQDEPSEFGCVILVSRNVGGVLNNLREFRGYTSIDHVLLDLLNKALLAEEHDEALGEVVQTVEELKEMIEERLKG